MTSKNRHRTKFHSKEDLANGHQLQRAESFLDNTLADENLSLNDLFELYNIKLFLDNGVVLTKWSSAQQKSYQSKLEQAFEILKKKLIELSDDEFEDEVRNLNFSYHDDFWKLISDLNAHKNISDKSINKILEDYSWGVNYILHQKKLVQKFSNTLRGYLVSNPDSAELLLKNVEQVKHNASSLPLNFPKSLTQSDKEQIINSYLDSDQPNLNYIRLIENCTDSEIRLSPKISLKAKKKSEELNEEIIQGEYAYNENISVSFRKDQLEPVSYSRQGNALKISYSEPFIDKTREVEAYFIVFKFLFRFIDESGLISLISKSVDLEGLERIFMKSKNEYEIGNKFERKEIISNLQILIFKHYLERNGTNIESAINTFMCQLNEKIAPHEFAFHISEEPGPYLEKLRFTFPDFDSFIKQYDCLVNENCINFELIQISSKPLSFRQVSSFRANKYLYIKDEKLTNLQYAFFSDQSHLFYINNLKHGHKCLYDLITKERVRLVSSSIN